MLESSSRKRRDVLGRSAATGKLVLKPASRPGQFTDKQISDAVQAVLARRKVQDRAGNA
jgi:hypothetical protein